MPRKLPNSSNVLNIKVPNTKAFYILRPTNMIPVNLANSVIVVNTKPQIRTTNGINPFDDHFGKNE